MELISLNCNHCGAPLKVPTSANFVTCSFCEASLAVQRTENAYSTEVLEEVREHTESLVQEVAGLRRDAQLAQLGREWAAEHEAFSPSGTHSRRTAPTKVGAYVVGIIGLILGIVALTNSYPLGFFILAGAVLFTSGLWLRADNFENAEADYQRRRDEIYLRDRM